MLTTPSLVLAKSEARVAVVAGAPDWEPLELLDREMPVVMVMVVKAEVPQVEVEVEPPQQAPATVILGTVALAHQHIQLGLQQHPQEPVDFMLAVGAPEQTHQHHQAVQVAEVQALEEVQLLLLLLEQ
jgi:hypothetical protein